MKFQLKEKASYNINRMEILKTTVGHALKQLLPENMVFTIASFLVESDEERTAKAKIKWWYESLRTMN